MRVIEHKHEPRRRYLVAILLLVAAGLIGYGWHRVTVDNKPGQSGGTLVIAGFPFETNNDTKSKVGVSSKLITSWQAAIAGRSGLVDIAVYDHQSGETAHYSNTGGTFNAASVEKLSILEATLIAAQKKDRGLTNSEQSLATAMIENSNNNAASALWNEAGGMKGMAAFYKQVGTNKTTVASGGQWGLTQTTATDQLKIMNQIAYPSSLLHESSRQTAYTLLDNVIPSQAWGVTAGLPASASVQLKNGWLPDNGTGNQFNDHNTWTANSVGHVRASGKDYTIAVLTMGNTTEGYGINTIQLLSSATWKALSN